MITIPHGVLPAIFATPKLSRNGRWLAAWVAGSGTSQIWRRTEQSGTSNAITLSSSIWRWQVTWQVLIACRDSIGHFLSTSFPRDAVDRRRTSINFKRQQIPPSSYYLHCTRECSLVIVFSRVRLLRSNFWKPWLGMQVHLQNGQVKFLYQGHRFKVKVTGAARLPADLRHITCECVQFWLGVVTPGHVIKMAVRHCPSEFYIAGIRNLSLICSCSLDLDLVTFIHEFNSYPLKMYPQTKNELSTSTKVIVLQTDRQTPWKTIPRYWW